MPAISKLVGRHMESLKQEPPISLGAPDPYVPSTKTSK